MVRTTVLRSRFARLVFGVDDPKAGAAGSVLDLLHSPLLNHTVSVTGGVLVPEVQELLAQFFAGLRDGSIPRFSEQRAQALANHLDSV